MSYLEKKLVQFCSTAMAKIKSSSMFSVKRYEYLNEELEVLRDVLNKLGIEIRTIYADDNRVLLLVFCKSVLENTLTKKENKEFLCEYGYQADCALEQSLAKLSSRISTCDSFPHEIGIFLGYPVEDVIGFITNPSGSKLCGHWKVYGDEKYCRALFKKYNKCTQAVMRRVESGHSLVDIF